MDAEEIAREAIDAIRDAADEVIDGEGYLDYIFRRDAGHEVADKLTERLSKLHST